MVVGEDGSSTNHVVRHRQAAWLRIYLGYAPGVGKTHAMLHAGRAQQERGMDVVVGWVHTHDRPQTLEAIGPLEVVAPRSVVHRGVSFDEMDFQAILARRPQLVLVDELAHTNVSGSRHLRRYQDVLELQAAGISVISTVNIQQLASLQETIRLVTGVAVTETLPDWVLDAADDLEMVDEPPEDLQKRVRRGHVLPAEQIEGALNGYFRIDTLAALRELTVRRLAEHTRRRLHEPLSESAGRETVLVCVPPSDQAQAVLRKGVHLADSLQARLVVLHVRQPNQSLDSDQSRGYAEAVKALQLAQAFGAEVHTRGAPRVPEELVQFAGAIGATQLVLGESSHSRLHELFRGSVLRQVLHETRNVDVHIVRLAKA
jgi:two-component system sensor histidine kinase KdpD